MSGYHLDLPRHRDDAEPSALQGQKRDGHHVRPQRGLERLSDLSSDVFKVYNYFNNVIYILYFQNVNIMNIFGMFRPCCHSLLSPVHGESLVHCRHFVTPWRSTASCREVQCTWKTESVAWIRTSTNPETFMLIQYDTIISNLRNWINWTWRCLFSLWDTGHAPYRGKSCQVFAVLNAYKMDIQTWNHWSGCWCGDCQLPYFPGAEIRSSPTFVM